jgi:hypothetical protein
MYKVVKLNRKCKCVVSVAMLLALCVGCGGINASHTVSPASFFLPGLLQADPKQPSSETVPQPGPVKEYAQAK